MALGQLHGRRFRRDRELIYSGRLIHRLLVKVVQHVKTDCYYSSVLARALLASRPFQRLPADSSFR